MTVANGIGSFNVTVAHKKAISPRVVLITNTAPHLDSPVADVEAIVATVSTAAAPTVGEREVAFG